MELVYAPWDEFSRCSSLLVLQAESMRSAVMSETFKMFGEYFLLIRRAKKVSMCFRKPTQDSRFSSQGIK